MVGLNNLNIRPISVKEAQMRLIIIIPKLELIQSKMSEYIKVEKKFSKAELNDYSKIRYELDVMEEDIYHLNKDIRELDCVIKDPKIGLIDFVAMHNGEPVWLCYLLGESELKYYHGWNEGFIGRKLINFD